MKIFSSKLKLLLLYLISSFLILVLGGCTISQDNIIGNDKASETVSVYDKIYNSMMEGISEVDINNVSEEEVKDAYISVLNDHPEIFWVSNGCSYKVIDDGKKTDIQLILKMDLSLMEKNEEFRGEVEKIISNLKPFESQYDAVLKIHDYIIDNTDYDKESYDEILNDLNNDKVYIATTAYGCLCEGKAVCSGYSAALQLLLQEAGIESGRVAGEKIGGTSHQWNYVKIDGNYYYIDETLDDCSSYDGRKSYDLFCITTDELKKTHIIGENKFVPECVSTNYDYYRYNHMYLETYDYDSAASIIKSSGGTIKFSTKNEADKAVQDLVDNKKIYDIISANEIKYYRSLWGNVLHFII